MYVFSGQSKLIYLQSGVTSFEVKDLYSKWKQWVGSGDNSKFQLAFQTIGGDSISATKTVAGYYFLKNNWKIKTYEESYALNVDGNLFVDGGAGNPFITTTGSYNVFINISTSSDSTVTQSSTDITKLNSIENKINDLTALSL